MNMDICYGGTNQFIIWVALDMLVDYILNILKYFTYKFRKPYRMKNTTATF